MFVFTLVQSRTHVDTVQSDLHSLTNSRDIYWSHTMKVLGWHVTFVRRSSTWVLCLRYIYFDMKVWSLMYVVDVQSVSIQCRNRNLISWYTRTTNSFVVVYAVKILNGKAMLCNTLRNVPISWDLVMFNLRDDRRVCLLSQLDVLRVQFIDRHMVLWCPFSLMCSLFIRNYENVCSLLFEM